MNDFEKWWDAALEKHRQETEARKLRRTVELATPGGAMDGDAAQTAFVDW